MNVLNKKLDVLLHYCNFRLFSPNLIVSSPTILLKNLKKGKLSRAEMGSVAIVDGIISSARPELVSIKEAEVLILQMHKVAR